MKYFRQIYWLIAILLLVAIVLFIDLDYSSSSDGLELVLVGYISAAAVFYRVLLSIISNTIADNHPLVERELAKAAKKSDEDIIRLKLN